METKYTDIAVLGGGAAGLTAAIHAARILKSNNKNATVVIIEKNPRVGKKLLSTGNGRCNLAHEPLEAEHYYGERALVRKVLAKSGGYKNFFSSLGLYCATDSEGRVYPHSKNASAVLDALRLECAALGVTEYTCFNCVRAEPLIEGFKLISENAECVSARRLIIACGGMAGMTSMTDGSADEIFNLINCFGIKVINPLPSLCPIPVSQKMTRPLKGLRTMASCSAILGGKTIKTEKGEVQFGNGFLSGICIMNLSRLASLNKERLTISLDLAPDIPLDRLYAFISGAAVIRSAAMLEDLLTGLLHKRIGILLINQALELSLDRSCGTLTASEAEKLACIIKDWRFPVLSADLNRQPAWNNAQCTAGGVPASELTDELMSVKKPDLYIAGEAVNVDGDCGGYNLAWAWASGEVAGISAAQSIIGR